MLPYLPVRSQLIYGRHLGNTCTYNGTCQREKKIPCSKSTKDSVANARSFFFLKSIFYLHFSSIYPLAFMTQLTYCTYSKPLTHLYALILFYFFFHVLKQKP